MMHNLLRKLLKPIAVFGVVTMLATQAFALSKLDENLIYNANFGEASEVRKFLDAGANPNAVGEDGWPTISLAAMRPDDQGMTIVRMLVDAGVNLNVRDVNGETPLMNAITNNNAPMVKYMIEHGADFRAVNKSGTKVLDFAKHYGGDEVVAIVQEAIRLEEERIREGRSRRHYFRMMDDYIYYNCVLQYLAYNRDTRLYPTTRKEEINRRIEVAQGHIGNAQTELAYNFNLSNHRLEEISRQTQSMIFDELEAMISNRNRLKYGVGSDKDLDKRCQKILGVWRESFEKAPVQKQ